MSVSLTYLGEVHLFFPELCAWLDHVDLSVFIFLLMACMLAEPAPLSPAMLQAFRLFTIFDWWNISLALPDFQHEVAMCKIFTYCKRVNKHTLRLLAGTNQKVLATDMKAWNSMWHGWVGCLCLRLRDWMTEQKIIVRARVFVRVTNLLCTSCEPCAAPCGLLTPQASAAAPVKMSKTSLFQIELLLWNHQHGNMPYV